MTKINVSEFDIFYECPVCANDDIDLGQKYCQECGEQFEWEDKLE